MINTLALDDINDILFPIKSALDGGKVVLSINFLRLGLPSFEVIDLLDLLFTSFKVSTIAIPSYSQFESNKNRYFSRYNSKVAKYMGIFPKTVFSNFPESRILNPTHSFIILGSEKPDFNHIYDSAFGFNSPYSYLLNQDYSWLNIACSLYETCSFMHHVEYLNSDKIVYRSKLKFPVSISLDRDDKIVKKIDYEYFGKTSEFQEYRDNWSPLDVLQNSLCHQFNANSGLYPLEYLLERGTQLLNQNSMIFCKPY